MEYDIYKAPKGYEYLKDGEYSLVVMVPKDSDLIKEYELVELKNKKEALYANHY